MKNRVLFLNVILIFILISNLLAKENHEDLIERLNNSFPAEIFFTQTDRQNSTAKGWMVIGKRGLARVEFEPPNHYIMVADGSWLIVHDAQYDRTTYLPLNKGILGALLYPEKFSSTNKLIISKEKKNDYTSYSIISKNFEDSELIIYFNDSDSLLKGWDIYENGKINVKVNVTKIKELNNLINYDEYLFKFPEFMRNNVKGFLGPYKRNFKKIPSGRTN